MAVHTIHTVQYGFQSIQCSGHQVIGMVKKIGK